MRSRMLLVDDDGIDCADDARERPVTADMMAATLPRAHRGGPSAVLRNSKLQISESCRGRLPNLYV